MDLEDVLINILGLLPAQDICRSCTRVCRFWRDTIDTPLLWKQLYERDSGGLFDGDVSEARTIYREFFERVRIDLALVHGCSVSEDRSRVSVPSTSASPDYAFAFGDRSIANGRFYWEVMSPSNASSNNMVGVSCLHEIPTEHRNQQEFFSHCIAVGLLFHDSKNDGADCALPMDVNDVVGVALDLTRSPPTVTFHDYHVELRKQLQLVFELPEGRTWWPTFAMCYGPSELVITKRPDVRERQEWQVVARMVWKLEGRREKEILIKMSDMEN
eukprot:TRINITY_DN740_c0_g1_i1.p1 TRINITY_DN740_c0_g1~~TRINITY_DN740_c0_g1_i1.p1  ORF type:complete len:272 (-),score=43.34 TRINITY_DN740_c0_g1_i1:37-852(-)